MSQNNKKILVDADILSHFMASGNITKFCDIFSQQKIVLKIVADEIRRHPMFRPLINNLISQGTLIEMPMPTSRDILNEFISLSRTKGQGESACMAVARYSTDIIASNNWKDIKSYCELHGIEYLSTLDFIYEAYRTEIMTLAECDFMIYTLLTMRPPSKLPHTTLEEFCRKSNLLFPINHNII